MAQDLTLGVKLTGDGSQLSGTLKGARNDVREFGTTTEREGDRSERSLSDFGSTAQKEGSKAARALRSTGTEVSSVSNHLGSMQRIATAALTTLVGFVGIRGISNEWSEIRRESELLERNLFRQQQLIETTGRTAERSAQQMLEQSRALALGTLQSTEGVMQAQQTLMTFRNIRGEVFDEAIEGALDLASAMGTDLNSTILQVAKALEDPVTGMTALTRSGTVFTAAQRDMVRGMVETNRTADAQAFILSELAAQYGGVAKAEAAGLAGAQDTIGQAMQEARLAIGEYLRVGERLSDFYNNTATAIFQFNDALASGDLDGHIRLMTTTATIVGAAAGAYAAYRSILVAATVAQWAFNTAVRANPLGIAITLLGAAAGALYTYRDEVTLAGKESFQTSLDVDGLTSSFHLLTEAQQENKRASLTADLIEMRVEAGRLGSELVEVSRKVRNSGQLTPQGGALPVATPEDIQKGRELRQELGMLLSDIDNGSQLLSEYEQAMAALGETTRDTDTRTRTLAETNAAASKAADELAKSTEAQADALEDLYDRLIPGRRETVQLARDIQTLNLAIAMGTGNIGQNIQAMGLLQQQFIEAQNDTDDLAKKTVDAAFTMEGAWDEVRLNGLRRLDDGFADLWEGAVDGSINAGKLMKRALAQTISEMAHMAFTRPITVQFATSMGFGGTGAGGQQAGGGAQSFGGMPSINGMMDGSGAIANAYRAFQGTGSTYAGTFGSELAVQTQGGLKAGFESFANSGFGNTALGLGGGFIGSKLGGSVFGESQEQQIGATVGGIAGQVLIPIPGLGAGIGSFLGSGLGSLFGSAPTKFSGRFGTTASLDRSEGAGKDGVFEHQADGRFYRETALGYAGFRDQGTERLQRAGVGEDKQWAEDLVNATAAMDALTVSVARSDEQVSTMRDTVQGLEASGRNAGEIIEFALKGRALAALESIGHTFSDAVTSLPAEEFTARMELMVGGIGTLMQSADRLNLQFDATASGALEAAGNLAQIAGGVDNLAAINQGYYQATYSETERLSRSQAELRESLAGVTDQVPTTVGELRALVEAQNLNDAAAGELAVRLMQLAPALKQTNDAVRQAIEEQYQESLGRAPEVAGMDHWFNAVASGSLTLEQALLSIENSVERYGDLANEIADAYLDSLGRDVDASGLEFWSNAVESGTLTLEQALESIANSAEAAAYQTTQAMAEALRTREQMDRRILTLQGNTEALREIEIQQLRAMQGAEEQGLVALQNRIWALEDAATAEQEAARAAEQRARAMEQAEQALANFTSNINNWLDQLNATDAGLASPGDQLAAASSAFNEQYQLALSGDRDALGSITQYASRFIDAQKGWSASGIQTAATIDRVTGMLETLPDRLSAEQFLAEEFRNAIEGQTETLNTTLIDTVAGGDLTEFADVISGQFASLDLNVDGFLTFNEMQAALDGKATDAEIRALIGAVDINGDGMISEMEALIAAESNGNTLLLNALSGSFNAADINVDGLLTFEEMKAALGPIASNEEIRNLISAVDVNGDGMISRQELTNARLYGLPGEISGALGTIGTVDFGELDFGRIDISTDGLLTFDEMQAALSGTATDAEIRNLISAVDVNGDGMISRQELAVARLGDVNTSVNGLGGLSGDIANALSGMFDDIADGQAIDYGQFSSALEGLFSGVASDQMLQSLFTMMDSNGDGVITRLEALKASGQGTESNTGATVETLLDQLKLDEKLELTYDGRGLPVTLSFVQDETVWGWIGNVIASKFGATNEHPGTLEEAFDGSHANGLEYVPFDGYRAELHKGEKVLTRADADLMRNGLNLPTANLSLPQFPTLGGSDVAQVLNDLKREVQQLRNDNKQLMEKLYQSSEQHKAVSSAGHQQSVAAQEKSAEQLKRMERRARLERAK